MKTKIITISCTVLLFIGMMLGCNVNPDPGAPSTVIDFETDHESWYSENANMLTTHNTNSAYVYHGTGSIKGACNISGTDPGVARVVFRYDPTTPIDMTGMVLQFNVLIPDSLANLSLKYGSKLWLYTTTWRQLEGPEISTAGWNHFTFMPSGIGEDSVSVIAIQIYKNDGTEADWTGDLYFDYFSFGRPTL